MKRHRPGRRGLLPESAELLNITVVLGRMSFWEERIPWVWRSPCSSPCTSPNKRRAASRKDRRLAVTGGTDDNASGTRHGHGEVGLLACLRPLGDPSSESSFRAYVDPQDARDQVLRRGCAPCFVLFTGLLTFAALQTESPSFAPTSVRPLATPWDASRRWCSLKHACLIQRPGPCTPKKLVAPEG